MFNTPPVFSIYVAMLTLRWIKENGGINVIEQKNNEKAKLIYSEIDRNSLFFGFTNIHDRSTMNATFNLKDEGLKNKFDELCYEAGISGIKGHRSIGGYRASMYNALNIKSVHVLVDVMKTLEHKTK
jgi:phosphoserine aminotransferase